MADLSHTEFRKAPKWSTQEQADGIRINAGPFVGIVKANTDPIRSGKLQVWIAELGGDPTDDSTWRTVSYCTPFYGVTNNRDGSDYSGSPHSYGMWFVPPDIGVKVLCTFVGGDPSRGYWFGCIPEWPSMHMIPGLSAPVDGSSPAPVVDFFDDKTDPSALNNPATLKKLPHSIQEAIWTKQGLLQDPDRGPGTSSAFRETPSRVFGISTPGAPINPADPQIVPDPENPGVPGPNGTPPGKKIAVKGRKGGHTFIMDDGDANGKNQMMRLRTAGGHMIMMNDTKDFIYVINSKGTSWVEINSQGDINVYSGSAVNISANSGINLETKGALKLHGGTIDILSDAALNIQGKDVNINGGGTTKILGTSGLHLKGASTYLTGDSCLQIQSGGHIDLKGSCVTLNTAGATPAQAAGSASPPKSMPTKEAWSGHKAASGGGVANPQAQPSYGANQGLPAGAAGPYGATNNYGSSTVTQNYGPMTNNIGPITYNSGPQGSFAGQSSAFAQYSPANYNNNTGGQSYTTLSNLQNISFGTGAAFDVSQSQPSYNNAQYSTGELQNNPGNLQYSSNDGFAVGFANNLAVYARPEDGIAALMILFDSVAGNSPLTCAQLIAAYMQGKVTDNAVSQFVRFMQSTLGVDPTAYVGLLDPATRIAWASAVIYYIQKRVIYSYEQIATGCAESLGVDPTTFTNAAQPTTGPWQNNGTQPYTTGYISPASPSLLSGGSSLIGGIVNNVVNRVVGGVLNNVAATVGTAIGTTVGGVVNNVVNTVGGTVNNVVNTVSSGVSTVVNNVSGAVSSTVSAATGLGDTASSGGAAYTQYIGTSVGSGQCVALVQAASNVGYTGTWSPGSNVISNPPPTGTVIATFGSNGTYQNVSGQSHAAIYLGQQTDANGNVTGIVVQDQWAGHACGTRVIAVDPNAPEGAQNFAVVTTPTNPSGVLVNGAPSPVSSTVDPGQPTGTLDPQQQAELNAQNATTATATSDARNLTDTSTAGSYYDPRTGEVVNQSSSSTSSASSSTTDTSYLYNSSSPSGTTVSGDGSANNTTAATDSTTVTPSAMNQIETGTTPTATDTSYLYSSPSSTSVITDTSSTTTTTPQPVYDGMGNFTGYYEEPTAAAPSTAYNSQTLNATDIGRNSDYTEQPVGIGVAPPAPPSDNLIVNQTPATPDQSNAGLTYDPRTNEVVNSSGADNTVNSSTSAPITTPPSDPGSGAATTGAQTTPQGSAATGSAAGSC